MKKLTIWSISLLILLGFMGLGLADEHYDYDKDHHNYDQYYYHDSLTHINPHFMITAKEGYEWNKFKAEGGPTYAGSPSWQRYVDFLEKKIKEFGVVDIDHIAIPYSRYVVNDWPDHNNGVEKLISNGTPVTVASYGMTSGFTPAGGITAPMLYYDPANKPTNAQIAGKILVFQTAPQPAPPYTNSFMDSYTLTDYEWRSSEHDWWPLFTSTPPSVTSSYWYRWVWSQVGGFATIGQNGNAAGMIIVYDMAPGGALGVTQRSVYTKNCPTLCLDRVNGAKVLVDAQAGKTATLTLLATFEPSVGMGIVGYLPGKYYGTDKDEMVMLATHTDAMSLAEENGGLGMLGIIHYFKHIPQSQRPRTLVLYFDCRHFMPGAEGAWPQYDYFMAGTVNGIPYHNHPEILTKVVTGVGIEHMGMLETIEVGPGGNTYKLSGRVETSLIDLNNNTWLINMVAKAAIDNHWPRVDAKSGNIEPGVNGGFQGSVKSAVNKGKTYGFTGVGLAGNWPGCATQTFSQLNDFDKHLFHTQVAGLTQITGELMLVNPLVIDLNWGKLRSAIRTLPDAAFVDPTKAATQRDALWDKYEDIFRDVEFGEYREAKAKLENSLKNKIAAWVVQANQAALLTLIDGQIAILPQHDLHDHHDHCDH